MPPRKRIFNSEAAAAEATSGGHSHKKRRIDAPSSPLERQSVRSIKMEETSPRVRRSSRLQQAPPVQATKPPAASASRKPQKPSSRPRSLKVSEANISKTKPSKPELLARPLQRRRKKASPVKQDQGHSPSTDTTTKDKPYTETDADGVVWTAMPYVSPDDLYSFSAEFYLPPVEKVQVGKEVGPPPVMVRIHIIDKKTGQEVSCENDPQWYYWTVAHILHEDYTPCTEPEFVNKAQKSMTPMSWYHEEITEDTRTPVTQTPPPDTPVKRWKTFVSFPEIVIPSVGKFRIRITMGVYIDQKLRSEDGQEKTRKESKDLVTITSEPIQVQEFEPEDEDKSVLEARSELWNKFFLERREFEKKQRELDLDTDEIEVGDKDDSDA